MVAYVIQVICFQALFLGVYYLLLRKETFFIYNRMYLLATPIIALVLPFIKIATLETVVPIEVISVMLPEVVIGEVTTTQIAQESSFVIPWLSIYILGMAISTLLLVTKLKSFLSYLSYRKSGEYIINVPNSTEAFTFFKYIFIGEDIDPLSRKQILTHEQIHAKQGHTWDLIFFEIMKIIFWFNPLIYFNQKLISTVHEYLADQKATAATSKKAYYEELLNTAFGTNNLSFTNTFFNQSLIKNRIIMLQKSKSKKSALIKYVVIVPLVLAMLVQVSWSQNSSKSGEVEKENFTLMESNFNNEKVNYSIIIIDTLKLASNEKAFLEAIQKNQSLDVSDFDLTKDISSTLNGMDKFLMFSSKEDIVEIKQKFDIKSYTVEELRKKYKLTNTYTSQSINKEEVEVVETQEELEIPFAVIDNVPTYPGCNELEGNEDKKTCMSDKVSKYVNANFNTSIAKPLGLTGINRVFVSFRINKKGQVDNVEARASHPDIAEEARRVIYNLPQMKPGSQKGEEVGVLYSLPITFKIAE